MSAKVCSERNIPKAGMPKTLSKVPKQKMDVMQCLKLLDSGKLQLSDVDAIAEEFYAKPRLGDHIQYQLHKYCQKDISQTNPELVVKLAELCYSLLSVSAFSNIDRFVGCAYYICSYLLKKEQYKSAFNVIRSLSMKKDEIAKCSKDKSDIRTFLCNFHSSLIATAIALASTVKSRSDDNYKVSHDLAMASLGVFKFINFEQTEIGKKLIKTSGLYLQTIKHYEDKDVLQFYKALTEVLKTLLPKLGSHFICFYYLHKVNQLKKMDSEEDVQAILKKTIRLLPMFSNSSAAAKISLDKAFRFFFQRCSESDWLTAEDFEALSLKQSSGHLHFLLVSTIFSFGIQFLWKKYEKNWCENISSDLVNKLANSLLSLLKRHCRSKGYYCNSGRGPVETCFGDLLTGNLQKIQYTIRLCLKSKVPDVFPLVSISRNAFRLSIDCLSFMESKGCCQEQRIYSWKMSVIHHTNTVEDICRLPPSDENWFLLKECSREVLKEIIKSKAELPFEFRRISILFQRWHTSNLKLKNYPDALFACIVYYVFYPKDEKEIMSMWIQAKSASCSIKIEEMTMSDILRTSEASLKEFNPAFDISKINQKAFLLLEIKAYGTCPPDIFLIPTTAYHLATRAFKQLEKLVPDLWDTSLALCALVAANVACENEELPFALQKKSRLLIDELMSTKGKMQSRSLLHAANLTFSLFLYDVKQAERSEGMMDTSHMVLGYLKKAEEVKVKFGEDVDLNLTCDVIPSSRHLTVALETNYLNELHKIVDMWNGALKKDLEDLPTSLELDLWQRNAKQVAQMYKLYGEYRRAFTTWLLYYKIGKLSGNSGAILLGLSRIIENCSDVDESGVKEEADLISGKLGSDPSEKYVLVEYFLAVASSYLKNKKPDKCLEYLASAKKLLEGLRTTIMTYALNARFWCLVNQFLVSYKGYEGAFDYPPGTDLRVMAFKAFSYANGAGRSDLVKTAASSECTELVLTMLEVNLWAHHLFGVYRQTDFMRFFLDDLYQIVQKLFLPTRTAEILVRLAEVDVMCEKVEDSQGKIAKLKSILTTVTSKCDVPVKPETPSSPFLSVPDKKNDGDVITTRPISPVRFQDKYSQMRELESSPFQYYLNDPNKTPASPKHVRKCKCRLCQNLLIQALTLNTVWVEAEMHNLNNNNNNNGGSKQAAKCYNHGYDMINKLKTLREEQDKNLRVELAAVLKAVPGELDFRLTALHFLLARFLIKYALFETSTANAASADVFKIMARVSKLMKTLSYEEKLLVWTFAELKLVCVVLAKEDGGQSKKSNRRGK